MKLDKANYEKLFKGYFILDCVVRRKDFCYFILEQEHDENREETALTSVVTFVTQPEKVRLGRIWGGQTLKGMQRMKAGVSYQPKEQFVGVSLNDHVYVVGSGEVGFEDDLQTTRNAAGELFGMRGGISKSRMIDGWLWLAGSGRTVGRRLGRNEWEWHGTIPDKSLMDDGGFLDIDGFSSSDIYAVGGHGDVWHFDGKKWRQIPFPTNMTLETVCCAGNGQVYIGADGGAVYMGRGERWKRIYHGDTTLTYRDLVWHQGKVWATSDSGVWVIEQDKVLRPELPDGVRVCAGHLSVADGVMLLAGMYGAALHDGKNWQRIIDFNQLG